MIRLHTNRCRAALTGRFLALTLALLIPLGSAHAEQVPELAQGDLSGSFARPQPFASTPPTACDALDRLLDQRLHPTCEVD